MQFFEKQFQSSVGFVLVPTRVDNLAELILKRIDLTIPFVIYQGDNIDNLDLPIVGHAGEYRNELLAPILSHPVEEVYQKDTNGRRVYMLDVDEKNPKIIQVPTGIPLVGMRDSYRYQTALQKFYTKQSVEQIFLGLKNAGWNEFVYDGKNSLPVDFTPVSELRKHLRPSSS